MARLPLCTKSGSKHSRIEGFKAEGNIEGRWTHPCEGQRGSYVNARALPEFHHRNGTSMSRSGNSTSRATRPTACPKCRFFPQSTCILTSGSGRDGSKLYLPTTTCLRTREIGNT